MKISSLWFLVIVGITWSVSSGYAFVSFQRSRPNSAIRMVDQNVIMAGGVAFAGLAAGIGLVAFTEQQGERAKARGGGLSDSMSTRLAGGLLEDVEVSSVEDVGSLTSQLEKALKEAGAVKDEKQFQLTEEEKKKKIEEADDGW